MTYTLSQIIRNPTPIASEVLVVFTDENDVPRNVLLRDVVDADLATDADLEAAARIQLAPPTVLAPETTE